MAKPGVSVAMTVILMALLVGLLLGLVDLEAVEDDEIRVVCAAVFREPMEEIARRYEKETGVRVVCHFGGSGGLAAQLPFTGGDLFFPAADQYLDSLRKRGVVLSEKAMIRLKPGLVVASGNPKGIRKFSHLFQKGVRVSLGNRSAAIGRVTWAVIKQEGLEEKMNETLLVTKPTVTEVVTDVALGAADVAIAWDAVSKNDARVEWIEIEELIRNDSLAPMAVLQSSFSREKATDFVDYCADPEKGGLVFKEMRFRLSLD